MTHRIKMILSFIKQSLLDPDNTAKKRNALNMIQQGQDFSRTVAPNGTFSGAAGASQNPLQVYFDSDDHKTIWKWRHYFDIYHHHLSDFQNRCPTLLEIGVYGGGSLEMWQSYFHQGSRIVGVDIDESCLRFADENISIHIGDQSDRQFWNRFKMHTAEIDIVIDDGGHKPDQQIITLEECLPLLNPSGVYICEDVHGFDNHFLDYIHGLSKSLYAYDEVSPFHVMPGALQKHIAGIHLYPFMIVIRMNDASVDQLVAEKRGESHDR